MAKGKVLQTIIDIAGEISPTLGKSIDGVTKKLSGINGVAIGAGAAVGGIAVATGKAVWEASKYLVELGTAFDSAIDTIRIGTGATGDDLDALMSDMEAVYSSVPTTMDAASQAIADYNTRLGLTGDELQGLSVQAIQVSDMLGEDLGAVIQETSQAFQQWGIDAEDMSGSMDYLFKVSQSTGIGFNDLTGKMQQYGAQFQDMGYSFEEAAALMGQLEKAGVNTDEVLAAMKKSVGALAKEGIDAAEGLELYYQRITDAGSGAEAAAIASEIFGTKAGSTMAAAIRNGTLSIADLNAELMANKETISGAAEDTYDFAEKLQMFKQKAEVALAPLATTLFDGLNGAIDIGMGLFEGLLPVIEDTVEAAMPFVTEFLGGIMDFLPTIIPLLASLAKSLLPMLSTFIGQLLPPLLDLITQLIPPILDIVEAILPALSSILLAILPMLTTILASVLPVLISLLNTLLPILTPILDVALMLLNDVIMPLLEPILMLVEALLPIIGPLLTVILAALQPVFDLLGPLAEVLGIVVGWIAEIVGWVAKGLTWVVDLVFGGGEAPKGLPAYAAGGFTNGISIAGEAGTEAVISFDPAYREQNLSYWAKAGRMLGADASDFFLGVGNSGHSGSTGIDFGGVTFAPNITITGHADKETIMAAIEEEYPEFMDMLEQYLVERGHLAYV